MDDEDTLIKVKVIETPKPEETKNYIDAPEYYENKIDKKDIEEIEID